MTATTATHDAQAERGYLSAVFNDCQIKRDVGPDLYVREHVLALDAMREILSAGRELTTDALIVALERAGLPKDPAVALALDLGTTLGRDQLALADRIEELAQVRAEARTAELARALLERGELAAARAALEALPERRKAELVFFTGEDELGDEPEPTRILLVRHEDGATVGFAEQGVSTLLAGPPGGGKSRFAAAVAVAVADPQGGRLGALEAYAHGRVLYVTAEETLARLADRFRWACRAAELDTDRRLAVERSLVRVGRDPREPALGEVLHGRLVPSRRMRRILSEAKAVSGEWGLVIVDTLARSAPPETEESAGLATAFVGMLETFCDELRGRPTVLCLHHWNKDAEKSDKVRESLFSQSSSRGSGGFVGAARVLINLRGMHDHRFVAVGVAKGNDVRERQWCPLVREPRCRGALRGPTNEEHVEAEDLFSGSSRERAHA